VSTRSFSSLATFHCHVAYNYAHNFCTVSLPSHKQWDILIGKQRHKLSKFVLPLTYSSRHSSEASKHTKITLRLHNCWIFSRSAAISIPLFMAALRSRCGHYIFCPVFSFFLFLSFSLVSSQPSQIGFLPYFHTWCGLSANFRMQVWNMLHAVRWNTGCKESQSAHHRTTLSGYINAFIDNRKKTC